MSSRTDRRRKNRVLAIDDCYRDETRLFVEFLDSHRLRIGYDGLARYEAWLREKSYAAATVNKRLAAAKNRLRLLFRDSAKAMDALEKYKLDTLLRDVRGVKLATRGVDLHKVLSLRQVRRLVISPKVPLRTRLFIEFLATTGLRVSELCRIRLADVRVEGGFCTVRILGKGDKERQIKAARDLVDRVKGSFGGTRLLFETRYDGPYARWYVSRQIKNAGALVLRKKISAHTLRHTFATLQIRRTRKVKGVSLYLGHSSTAITQDMYVHEELDLADLRMDLGRSSNGLHTSAKRKASHGA